MALPNPKWEDPISTVLDVAAAVDKGGGEVGLPITGHTFLAGQIVTLAGTVNYNGAFAINSKTTNEIVITATYVAEVFTGAETVVFGRQPILKQDFKDLEDGIIKIVTDVVSSATPTPAVGSSGAPVQYNINALAGNAAFGAPTGTSRDGQELVFRILDAGVGKDLTWASGAGGYIARGATPPATSGTGKYRYVYFVYNANANRWDCVMSTVEA